jgi:hypothetical protein|tara:strand:+ start:435 stop:845 length:411 start_codon:yes stop_codon:yes gene_type:complete
MARYCVLVTAWGFFIYGLLFIVFPQEALQMLVQGKVSTRSELIDLRATYGGMMIGLGLLLFILANNVSTIKVGLLAVFILMLCMALGRIVGIVIDGEPNQLMYIYLALELLACALSWLLLRAAKKHEQSHSLNWDY